MQTPQRFYRYYKTRPNLDYQKGLKTIPDRRGKSNSFESCLKHNNSEKLKEDLIIKTQPKWNTDLQVFEVDEETGELKLLLDPYITNEMKAANGRKRKAVNKFCDFYEPLYKDQKVTLLFLTLTRMNYAKMDIASFLDNVKYHFKNMLEKPILGYIWILEVSEDLHAHYHICIAIERIKVKKIPKELFFEKLWGQHTKINMIKKTIRGYMSKYLTKDSARIIGFRAYGRSAKFNSNIFKD